MMDGDGSSDEAWDGWYFGTNLVVKLEMGGILGRILGIEIGGGFGDWYCEILLWTRGKVKKKRGIRGIRIRIITI
jgi:hypothetical protein